MHFHHRCTLGAVAVLHTMLLGPVAARAQDATDSEQAGAADALYSCKAINDDRERLECYDREVGALQVAEASNQVLIVDQAVVKKARRDLFGFSLPKIDLFNRRGSQHEVEEIREIEDTLKSFRFDPTGRAMFTLGNGGRWMQIDNAPILGEPSAGDKVVVESAALGSFKARIGGRRAIRVKRVN